jgi:hypothetical protein
MFRRVKLVQQDMGKETPINRSLSKAGRLALKPILALALVTMLLASFMLDAKPAAAYIYDGEFCIEALVIDHEEKPLSGWEVTITDAEGNSHSDFTAEGPDSKEEAKDPDVLRKGWVKFEELFVTNEMTTTIPLTGGIYTATLTLKPNYMEITPAEFSFPLRANMKDCVKIRFKVKAVRVVHVYKFDRMHNLLEDWTILAKPAADNLFAQPQEAETDENGLAVFTLTKGTWIFMERPPDKDDAFRPIVPPSGKAELNVEASDDPEVGPYVLRFKNELLNGCIEAFKYGLVPTPEFGNNLTNSFYEPNLATALFGLDEGYEGAYPLAGWGFKLLRADYSVVDIKYTDATGKVKFDNLPFGPYYLVEEDRVGWTELNDSTKVRIDVDGMIEIVDEETGMVIGLERGCEQAWFANEQDEIGFVIEGRKLDVNGNWGLKDWEIKIKPLDKGGYNEFDTPILTNWEGVYRIEFPDNDYRLPGAKFEICEVIQDGWEPLTPTCQVITLPEKPTAHPVRAKDFINQQIGHQEHKKPVPHKPGKEPGKGEPGVCSNYHVVKKGEGLFSIGAAYGVSPQAMLNANPTVRDNANYWVFVGQRLCIP